MVCVGIVIRTGENLDSAKRWLIFIRLFMILFLLRYGAKYFGDGNGESYKFLVCKETLLLLQKLHIVFLRKVELPP